MSIGLIIDIIFLVLIGICFLISLYRNPFFSLINLILFIISMVVLKVCLNPFLIQTIENSTDFNSLSEQIVSSINSFNQTISDYNDKFGTSLILIDETFSDPNVINGILHSFVYAVLPISYSLASLLVSYILSWIIFGILRATCLKDLSLKLKTHKGIRYLINVPLSLIFVIFFGISFFNPINFALNYGNETVLVAEKLSRNENLNKINNDLNSLESSIDEVCYVLDDVKDNLNDMNEIILNYEDEIDELVISLMELRDDMDSSINDCKTLKTKSLSSNDKTSVDEIEKYLLTGRFEIVDYLNDIANIDEEIGESKIEINSAINDIDASKNELKNETSTLNETLSIINTYQKELTQIFNNYGNYINLIKPSILFSWLFNIDIYQNYKFTHNNKKYSTKDLINELIEYFSYVNNDMLNEIATNLSNEINNYDVEINKAKEEANKVNEEVLSKKEDLESYEENFDEYNEYLTKATEEYNTNIKTLNELKTKYNID